MSISAARMLRTHRLQPKPPRAQAITPLPPTRRLGPTAGRHTIKRSPGGIPGKNDLDRAVTTPLTSSARASNCLPAGGRRHWATREHARSASPFPGYRKRDRGRHQLVYEETELRPVFTTPVSPAAGSDAKLTTLTCANPRRMVQPAVLRTAPLTRQSQGRDPISPALNWGNVWQVQGSNLGRLSRRFYRPLSYTF